MKSAQILRLSPYFFNGAKVTLFELFCKGCQTCISRDCTRDVPLRFVEGEEKIMLNEQEMNQVLGFITSAYWYLFDDDKNFHPYCDSCGQRAKIKEKKTCR